MEFRRAWHRLVAVGGRVHPEAHFLQNGLGDFHIQGVVLHQKHPFSVKAGAQGGLSLAHLPAVEQGQGEVEGAALSGGAGQLIFPPMSRVSRELMERPRPVPRMPLESTPATCSKERKTRS